MDKYIFDMKYLVTTESVKTMRPAANAQMIDDLLSVCFPIFATLHLAWTGRGLVCVSGWFLDEGSNIRVNGLTQTTRGW